MDGSLVLEAYEDLLRDRQVELEVFLEPGKYIVVPRTTGANLFKPLNFSEPEAELADEQGNLTPLF